MNFDTFPSRWRGLIPMLAAMAAVAVPCISAQEVLATSGGYRYQTTPGPNQELSSVNYAFGTGKLSDGDTYNMTSWPGDGSGPATLVTAFDLRRDVPLKRVVVHSRFPNQYWGISSITIEAREAQDERYQVVGSVLQPGSAWTQLSIPTNDFTARYIRIKVVRAHTYVYTGLAECQFYTASSSAPLQPVTDLSAEFAREIEVLAVNGNYRYGNKVLSDGTEIPITPEQENLPNTEIPFSTGQLTNGLITPTLKWPGGPAASQSMPVTFDLLRNVPVNRVRLHSQVPNQYWEVKMITLETRSSSSATYGNPMYFYPTGTSWTTVDFPLNGDAVRFVRITVRRENQYLSSGLGEIRIYHAKSDAPLQPAVSLAGEFDMDTRLMDKFGQFIWNTWPGKITQASQFVTDKNNELASLPTAAPAGTDIYGGKIGATNYGGPGYFHTQQINGRWWLITPLGNKFFLNALCDLNPKAWAYATSVEKSDGVTTRGVFQELPSSTAYPGAYTPSGDFSRVNFIVPNLIQKYGADYMNQWSSVMQRRMWDWGLNSHGKWEKMPANNMLVPFVSNLYPASGMTRIEWAADPFEPNFEAKVRAGIETPLGNLAASANNKWVVGVTFENEAGWNLEIVKAAFKLPATRAAKIALVDHLFAKHTTAQLSTAFGFTVTQKADLLGHITWPSSLNPTGLTFIKEVAGPKYWGIVGTAFDDYNTSHLFLGGALVPGWRSSFEWEVSAAPFVDVISLDCYRKTPDWFATSLYSTINKPFMLLEHGFVTTDNGRRPFPNTTCESDMERGRRFRSVVEGLAAYPNFVGSSYFVLFDQSLGGRENGGSGESFSFGMLNQQDQPATGMVNELKPMKFPRLYDVHEGTAPPYNYVAP